MKKILVSLLVLALCAPAMADVTITGTDEGSGVLKITISPSGGAEVRGVALLLGTSAGDAEIDATGDVVTTGLNTNIDYFATNGVGEVVGDTPDGEGHSLADPAQAGVIDPTGGISDFSLCAGYLDAGGGQAGYAVDSFFDITYTVTVNSTVTIELDQLRGGVQGTDLGTVTIATPTVDLNVGPSGPTCQDDYNLTRGEGATDNLVNVNDLNALVDYVNNNKTGALWVVTGTNPNYDLLYNLTKKEGATDNLVNVNDLNALVDFVNNNKAGALWVVNCLNCGC